MIRRLLALLLLAVPAVTAAEPRVFDAADLAAWPVWGVGSVVARPALDAVELREGTDSAGVNLVSPEDVVGDRVRVELKPLRREGVVVLVLGAEPLAGGPLRPPDDYRGGLGFWRDAVRGWALALHTGFHQPDAFIAELPGWEVRASGPDPAAEERWYRVEAGVEAERVWLAVDGERVLEVPRAAGSAPGAGRLALRLRGPGDGSFGCLVRRLEILGSGGSDRAGQRD